ncbi:MAG: hypothetical protein JXR37_24855 [Kiritimatiellae bacterium]|nr:hypothetical protein [Kiritimatiellia bacterium]
MTLRALIIGLLLALLIAAGGHFNDVYMQQTFIVGNLFPISVIGFLVLLVLVVNPVVRRARARWAFRPAELAVIVGLAFAVCVVPGSGFLRPFSTTLVLSSHYEKMLPSWQKNRVLSYVPERVLPVTPENTEEVLGAFLKGKGRHDAHIGLGGVPWRAWLPTLARWIPLFFFLMAGLIGLSLVFHRQWTTHEHLIYPIAEFAGTLSGSGTGPDAPASRGTSVIAQRLFWYGFVPIFLMQGVNGLHAWFPTWLEIPHHIDITPLRVLCPNLASAPRAWSLFYATIYPTVVAFAFFLPGDITLSLGLSALVTALFGLGAMTLGVPLVHDRMNPTEVQGLLFGAYFGTGLFILYTGRAYYWRVLLAALGRRSQDGGPEPSAVWGLRTFALGSLAACAVMVWMGLPWVVAAATVFLLVLMYSVMSRVCAETGLFFMAPEWLPVAVLAGFLGAPALGPRLIALLALISCIIAVDPREAMMPFMANALRIAENARVARGRLAMLMGGTLGVGLIAGLVVMLWLQYDRGVGWTDPWATQWAPRYAFNCLDGHIQRMKADGVFEAAENMTAMQRVQAIRPNTRFVGFFLTGLALLLGCAFLRLRFSAWPVHPVLFLVWFTWNGSVFAWSFLIGWAVKALVVRFGGGRLFHRLKPLMVGVIAGDLACGILFMIAGAVYYAFTGRPPERFGIFPY